MLTAGFFCGFGMAVVCRGFVAGLVGRFPFWVVGVWCDERVGCDDGARCCMFALWFVLIWLLAGCVGF